MITNFSDCFSKHLGEAKQKGYQKPAIIMTIGDWEESLKDAYVSKWGEDLPVEAVERGSTDYRTNILKLREKNPDTIFLATNFGDALWFVQQMKELNLDWQLFSPAGSISPEIQQTGARIIAADWERSSDDFIKKFKEKYGAEPTFAADTAYDAVKITATAMQSHGTTPERIKEGLLQITNYNGASGNITIMQNRDREARKVVLNIIE